MLQDNLRAIWAMVKCMAHFGRYNRPLRTMILHLKNCGLILHSVWVPSAYQPADPLSRTPYFSQRRQAFAWMEASHLWGVQVQNMFVLEYKGVTFIAA